MLGDVHVYGSFSCRIDEKGRIFLPSATNAEKDDKVVFCRTNEGNDVFDAYSISTFSSRIDFLDEQILASLDDGVVEHAKSLKKQLCVSVLAQVNVDVERRISINNSLLPLLADNTTKLYALGEGSSIKFFGSEESYEKYTGYPFVKGKRG